MTTSFPLQVTQAAALADPLPYVPVLRPLLPKAETIFRYLQKIDESRIYSNMGPLAQEFESRIEARLGLPKGGLTSTSSGTASIVGAVLASAGRATAERPYAMMPNYTFVATAVAAEQCGYRPYMVDIDPDTWMVDPEVLALHPLIGQVGLVIPVAPYGRPVAQAPWQRFRVTTGIPVVIDGAASFDRVITAPAAFVGPVPVTFSFHATKSYSSGEGGGVASTDLALIDRTRQALNFGFLGARDCRMPSTNGKLSEYHAAVGLAEDDGWADKARSLQDVIAGYRGMLGSRFHGAPDLSLSYGLLLCDSLAQTVAVLEAFDRAEIGSRQWYGRGLHHQSYYSNAPTDRLEISDSLAQRLIGLPMAPDLSLADIARVSAAVTEGLDIAATQ